MSPFKLRLRKSPGIVLPVAACPPPPRGTPGGRPVPVINPRPPRRLRRRPRPRRQTAAPIPGINGTASGSAEGGATPLDRTAGQDDGQAGTDDQQIGRAHV